ncbi:glycoside hydrolase superfamily [Xylaria cf. heliscus]|nr:glycoside hydrolase superfamily [Xylaria cf. heliscus]
MKSIFAFCLLLLSATFVSAGYNSAASNNVAVYWGQNSANGANTQRPLIEVCRNEPDVNIILLAFLTSATNIDGGLNFANSYRPTEQEIIECQTAHRKTLLLSLAGAVTDASWSFASEGDAVDAANRIWAAFGPVSSTGQSSIRPFGSASVDGFDLDFETSFANSHAFAQQLQKLMEDGRKAGQPKFYLAAAPQCPFPDMNLYPVLHGAMAIVVDFIFIQFYNNASCDMQNPDNFERSLRAWNSRWTENTAAKIFMGVPGSATAVSPENRESYIEGSVLADSYIRTAQSFSRFAGVMIWDVSQMEANTGFLPPIATALNTTAHTNAVRMQRASSGTIQERRPIHGPTREILRQGET